MKRFVVFLLTVIVLLYFAVLYNSPGILFCCYAAGIIIVFFTIYDLILLWGIQVSLEVPAKLGETGQKIPMEIIIRNRSFLPAGQVQIRVRDSYELFGEKRRTHFSAFVPGQKQGQCGVATIHMEYFPRHSGRIILELQRGWVCDFLGVLAIPLRKRSYRQKVCVSVLPETFEVPLCVSRGTRDFAVEQECCAVRGEKEASEIWQIREYRPGDRLRSIHWKLSAKEEELMVSERTTEAGCPVLLFLDYDNTGKLLSGKSGTKFFRILGRRGNGKRLEEYISVSLSLSLAMARSHCGHYVIWYDNGKQDVMRYRVENMEQAYRAFREIGNPGRKSRGISLEEMYRMKYRENSYTTKIVLDQSFRCICNEEQSLDYSGKNKEKALSSQEICV